MYATTKNDWLTNLAAVCVIIFSLTGSAMFVTALLRMYQPVAQHTVLLPAPSEGISAEPLLPMQVEPLLPDDMESGQLRAEPMRRDQLHGNSRSMSRDMGGEMGSEMGSEQFERASVMASYKAMHSIL